MLSPPIARALRRFAPALAGSLPASSARSSVYLRSVCLGATLLAAAWYVVPSARAEIYEYVDAEGVSHFTNVPDATKRWKRVAFQGRSSRAIKTPQAKRDHNPERFRRYDAHIEEAARLYQLPAAFLRAVMHVESNFDSNVVSVDGAMGLMQLMPFTAERMGVANPFDPRQNILGGARFLRILANQWNGDLVLTVASYNAGAGAVERYKGVPPYGETRRYVNKVLSRYYTYRSDVGH
jgi:soluble lytic murein transglycosylase-like protein